MKRITVLALVLIPTAVLSAFGGSRSEQRLPENRLIVPGLSVGGVRLSEPRRSVEKAFGQGTSTRRGLVWYFGRRLLVDYWFHDQLTGRVEGLETTWGSFRTRSGVHVGSSRRELRSLHVTCFGNECSRATNPMPDAPGIVFTMRSGKVIRIDVR